MNSKHSNSPQNYRDPSGLINVGEFFEGLGNSVAGLINGLGNAVSDFFRKLPDLLSSEEFRVILIVAVSFYTGGAAGAAAGGGWTGAVVGGIAGGLTGAFTGTFHAQLSGDDPGEWMKRGFEIGMVVGSVSGDTKGFGLFEDQSRTAGLLNICKGAAIGAANFINTKYFWILLGAGAGAYKAHESGVFDPIYDGVDKKIDNLNNYFNQHFDVGATGGQCAPVV